MSKKALNAQPSVLNRSGVIVIFRRQPIKFHHLNGARVMWEPTTVANASVFESDTKGTALEKAQAAIEDYELVKKEAAIVPCQQFAAPESRDAREAGEGKKNPSSPSRSSRDSSPAGGSPS